MTSPSATTTAPQKHPRGLATLFFTEMWERFSFYGMRALLVLFMVDSAPKGGMALSDPVATAIYGIYMAMVYLMALPGGWLADRILGAQRAVLLGGSVIALGHFVLAIPLAQTFYLGLVLVVIGSGILKPNMSTMVADLYPEGGARRDAGFSIFYMGINLGAFLGPLVCGWLATSYGWHYGFAAAGVGMVLGLLQFQLSRQHLGTAGANRGNPALLRTTERVGLAGALVVGGLVVGLALAGILALNPVRLAQGMAYVILAIAVLYFGYVFLWSGLDKVEKERMVVILVLFLSSALFWAGFEQAGSSFNLFAARYIERNWFNFEIPAAWFQALGPIFIVSLAPVFAWLWVRLARRNLNPSIPAKFGFGLLLLAIGFAVMAGAARIVAAGHKAWPTWLISTYLIHTFAELCVSPVGLSSVTKLAPRRLVGQMMGVWFLASSLGNLLAGLLAGEFNADTLPSWPTLYLKITILPVLGAVLLFSFARPIKRWIGSSSA